MAPYRASALSELAARDDPHARRAARKNITTATYLPTPTFHLHQVIWKVRPMGTILLVILILLLLGALPTWPYSGGWGYYPSGGLGLILLIVVILLVLGRI
jgi:hypothetical protein